MDGRRDAALSMNGIRRQARAQMRQSLVMGRERLLTRP
jgi:hypothetical protein